MKIKTTTVIFNLSSDAGMPIYVGNKTNPEFIIYSAGMDWFDAKVENLLADHDLTPAATHYKLRLRQACVLT